MELKPFEMMVESVRHNGCGCYEKKNYQINTYDDFRVLLNETSKGIEGKCAECQAIDDKYHMIKMVGSGEFDWHRKIYVFDTQNIKDVVRYCRIKGIHTKSQSFEINSIYDCTGQCHRISAKVTRGKKYITVSNTFYLDL